MTPQEKAKIQIEYYTRILNGESYRQVNKDLQFKNDEGGFCDNRLCVDGDAEAQWSAGEYRWKPKTITVNGKEVPAPMDEMPKSGKPYWFIGGINSDGLQITRVTSGGGDNFDRTAFKYGIFNEKNQAEEYFNALIPKVRE